MTLSVCCHHQPCMNYTIDPSGLCWQHRDEASGVALSVPNIPLTPPVRPGFEGYVPIPSDIFARRIERMTDDDLDQQLQRSENAVSVATSATIHACRFEVEAVLDLMERRGGK